ncbi:RND family transporter [Acidocella sp.]|uniref:efflux RND transporter permease subunit n=1 Tax=Acidocella sp. TaxID=50710 RepID=UPI00260E74EA|nr:MMPL family transporter [Acidocella sp.]
MDKPSTAPVIADIADFDKGSGSFVERVLFNNRPIIMIVCALATLFLGFEATKVRLSADYSATIPVHQPYIVNYLNHYDDLSSSSNAVQIAVVANNGTILNAHYLQVLQNLNNDVYLLPGVNRPFEQSLWSPQTTWHLVTPDGMTGNSVMDQNYDGSPKSLQIVATHIQNAGIIGTLVGLDYKSTMIYAPLLLKVDGKPLDYGALARGFNDLRKKYDSQGVTLHMIGFAMVVGDMINGIGKVLGFFLISIVITSAMLFWYTRCLRSTALVVTASLTAVVWQMGILALLGLDLTPYSVLVPFLVFAIGMSHGAQKMNGVMQDIGRGTHRLVAARYTFRRLFLAGFVALICDATSFAVLMVIRIGAIQQLATVATIGVALLVITNLILIPITLSYIGVNPKAAERSQRTGVNYTSKRNALWLFLDMFTHKRAASVAILGAMVVAGVGYYVGRNVQIGDLEPGAPELRQNSQYNKDNAYIIKHYAVGSDEMVVMVDTPPGTCLDYPTLSAMDRLQWQLEQMPEVRSASSAATFESYAMAGQTEGSPKWFGIEPDPKLIYQSQLAAPRTMMNFECSFVPINISLVDHKAATLTAVLNAAQKFINDPNNQGPGFKMSLVGGSAGIEAATNIVVAQANTIMLVLIYAVVTIFCFIAFRSWRAVLCAMIPLAITSILAQALMVWLHIGVKVATLPVSALGVGIGVDYALYVLSILLRFLRGGLPLSEAYYETLMSTGKVVLLTGFTLALGVSTWIFAPIKFQADMGLLLAFMFLWNMLGAMILLPALAAFLLPPRLFVKKPLA